ncbi:hypothetical protein K8R30_03840 [archaeon]|nr:hypothetical protein [archaeon]
MGAYKVERIKKEFPDHVVMVKVDEGFYAFLNKNFTGKGRERVPYLNKKNEVRNFDANLLKHNNTGKVYAIGALSDYSASGNFFTVGILNVGENNPEDLGEEIEGVLSDLEKAALAEVGG